MAAVHPTRQQQQHSRMRSASDPFVDPASPTKSKRAPPPPPPKQGQSAKMPAAAPSRNSSNHDITEAVRDTVVVHTDPSSRSKPSRTQPQAVPAAASRTAAKRSQSEDIAEKSRSSAKPRSTGKKGSQHADVIDRLDFTGVGPMFHHDGPFDACAPSRNKHRNKAPMYAWGTNPADVAAPQYGDSAYPSPNAYKAFSNDYPEPPKKKVDAIAEAWGIHEPEPFEEFFAGGGTGRHDGDTPASSIHNGNTSHTSRSAPTGSARRPKDPPPADTRPRMTARRSLVPPPQPIFVGEPAEMDQVQPSAGSPPASSPGFPKRSKSIMHRIRKMRDAPNVPVAPDYGDLPPSPVSPTDPSYERPTHKTQNSFLGRFGGSAPAHQSHQHQHQPQQHQQQPSEPFVLIEPQTHHNKDLPQPPGMGEMVQRSGSGEYFDANNPQGSGGVVPSSPGGNLGRRSSLMKKVGRVVRGTK